MSKEMIKTIVLYSSVLALSVFALQWFEFHYSVRLFSTQIYIAVIALGFCLLGIWVGHRLTRRESQIEFVRNEQAIRTLGLSERELQVLDYLAQGQSNQEIAKSLHLSTNTIKTHLSHVYQKLEVSRRTQAVQKARNLSILP